MVYLKYKQKDVMKQRIAFAVIMGFINTCIISFTLVTVNVGFTERFLEIWLRSWAIAFCIVIPGILFFGPRVQALINKYISNDHSFKKI